MFCPYCGNPCAETHKFCFRCGKALPELITEEPITEEPITADPVTEEPVVSTDTDSTDIPVELPETESACSDIPAPIIVAEEPTEPAIQPKRGRLWPPLLVLCLILCVGLAAFFLAPKAPVTPPSCFRIENGVLYFDQTLYTGTEELIVPAVVDGMPVTGISDNCFSDCDSLTTIILPETVTIIGEKAFAGCDALRGIYIPDGVLSVGAGALSQCSALEAVYFPGSLTEIGEGCLDDCSELQYIIFDGTYAQWRDLYDGIFRNQVELHAKDGVYKSQP